MSDEKRNPPFGLDMPFGEAVERFIGTKPEEITQNANQISILAPKSGSKEITSPQGVLDYEIEKDVGGIGMGVLSDGTPYLNQRGLAALCGVENAHIGTISSQWNEPTPKPRVAAIKSVPRQHLWPRFEVVI